MKKLTIFTLIALFAFSAFAGQSTTIVWSSGQQAGALNTFMSSAIDGDGNLSNDAGHQAAAEAMMNNVTRSFEKVLATDISTMTAEEQMNFFSSVSDILSTMGEINAYAREFGYTEVTSGMYDLSVAFGLGAPTWGVSRIDNDLILLPNWDATFVDADRKMENVLEMLRGGTVIPTP